LNNAARRYWRRPDAHQRYRSLPQWLGYLFILFCTLPGLAVGDTLDKVRGAGMLNCGVSAEIPGLASQTADGQWSGMDVDFCRAVAAAVVGSPQRVRLFPLAAAERFPALLAGRVDLIAGGVSWTLAREAGLKVDFIGPVLYSSQRVLVHRDSGIESLGALAGLPVCVEERTTHVKHLQQTFEAQQQRLELRQRPSFSAAVQALKSAECKALTADDVALASVAPPDETNGPYQLLPEVISGEALSAVVKGGNPEWSRAVKWVLFALIGAEAQGIDGGSAATLAAGGAGNAIATAARKYGKALGLAPDWAERAIAAGGHYGELYARNLGQGSPLKLPRGRNQLWTSGGMLYAPPLQ
jgi:general L-amino acid transport system substrate-binding protein